MRRILLILAISLYWLCGFALQSKLAIMDTQKERSENTTKDLGILLEQISEGTNKL